MLNQIKPTGQQNLDERFVVFISKNREVAEVYLPFTDMGDLRDYVEAVERVQSVLAAGEYESIVAGNFFEAGDEGKIAIQLTVDEAIQRAKQGTYVTTLGPMLFLIAAKQGPLPAGFEGHFLPSPNRSG